MAFLIFSPKSNESPVQLSHVCVCVCVCVCLHVHACSVSVISDSLGPQGLWPTSLLYQWDFTQARILKWVAITHSKGSSWPRDRAACLVSLHWWVNSLPLHYLESPNDLIVSFKDKRGLLLGMEPALLGDFSPYSLYFLFKKFLLIYLAASGLSCGTQNLCA